MPALTAPATGASGFIGTWIVGDLLKRGFSVRASVRSESKGKHLLGLFSSYADKLTLTIVPDMEAADAFDAAVRNVDGIVHTASLVRLDAVEPKDIIEPAVAGTLSILGSALKVNDRLKRVVITSSCATVLGPLRHSHITEEDWDVTAVPECEAKGKDAPPETKYRASKILAERAIWEFNEKHKGTLSWDITTIIPPIVFGPILHDVPSPDKLGISCLFWRQAVLEGKAYGGSLLTTPGHAWVDVRDVSEAHVLALEVPAAGGERIIVSGGSPFVWQDFINVANALSPSPYPSGSLSKGEVGDLGRLQTVDNSKSKSILGIKYKTIEELTRDTLADFESRGW